MKLNLRKEAGFESHLEHRMSELNFGRNEWGLSQDPEHVGGVVLRVGGFDQAAYEELAYDLTPGFAPVYSAKFNGLIFRQVQGL